MATRKRAPSTRSKKADVPPAAEVWGNHEHGGFVFSVSPFMQQLQVTVQHVGTSWRSSGYVRRVDGVHDAQLVDRHLARPNGRGKERANGVRGEALAAWRAVCAMHEWSAPDVLDTSTLTEN